MSENQDTVYKFKGSGLKTKEKKWGTFRFKEYCKNYPHLHKMSDLLMLEELVFQEALHERIKEKIDQITVLREKRYKDRKKEEKKDEEIDPIDSLLPASIQAALNESMEIQFKMKGKLGLFEDKAKLDAYRDFEELREDFKEYRRRNPHLFKTTCPSCSFIFFLKRRTDCYEEIDSPWFKDKVLCNPELWDAYRCKEISKARIAKILGVSEDYIDWLADKIFNVAKKNDSLSDEPSLEILSLPVDDSSEKK